MAAWARAAAMAMALAGCAASKQQTRPPGPEPEDLNTAEPPAATAPAPAPAGPVASAAPPTAGQTYVDKTHHFKIDRPGPCWSFKTGEELASESIEVPVVVACADSGAQVVVQVAPAVATPGQFAQRLTSGLRTRTGFETTDAVPIALAEGAVGFDFAVQDQVKGKVAILDGGQDRVFVLLATWPLNAPSAVEKEIDQIMASLKTEAE